jgi:hypothetical protein
MLDSDNIWLRRLEDRPAARENRAEVRRETAMTLLYGLLAIVACVAAACMTVRSGNPPAEGSETAYVMPG